MQVAGIKTHRRIPQQTTNLASLNKMFYQPGITHHNLPRDPFKVKSSLIEGNLSAYLRESGMRCTPPDRMDLNRE